MAHLSLLWYFFFAQNLGWFLCLLFSRDYFILFFREVLLEGCSHISLHGEELWMGTGRSILLWFNCYQFSIFMWIFSFSPYLFFFRKYLFLSQEFPELESMPRFQLNCIIPTYFLCIFCFFFSYRMSSFKENNLCNLCTIVTSWLGCTDIVESHYHNAQWFSFTIAKGYHVFF